MHWEKAIMAATNFSQIFLFYNVLYDSIIWARSVDSAYCRSCRRRNDPDKMLLCDKCNGGHHMFCLKPKIKIVPKGDWFCPKCAPEETEIKKKSKRRKIFSENSDDDEEENEDDEEMDVENETVEEEAEYEEDDDEDNDDESDEEEEEEDKICKICKGINDQDEMAECEVCSMICHLDCALPPLNKVPRRWTCWRCKKRMEKKLQKKTNKKPKKNKKKMPKIEIDNDFDERKPRKRGRPSRGAFNDSSDSDFETKKPKIDADDEVITKNPRDRRSRADDEDLPLHNVILYDLLNEIGKHEDSWPFNRPVQKNEVRDYYEIIKTPMDFAKIKSRLNLGHYKSDYDIMNDIQQVFINCDLYNTSNSEIYK